MSSALASPASPSDALRAQSRTDSGGFFTTLPIISGFHQLADPGVYAPVPDDWSIGLTDVVASTEAIRAGRYKAVNTAGAAVISAVSNALGTLDFPYVFSGDGMCYAVAPAEAAAARQALARSIAWVGSELDLKLRGGEISVAAIRATGRDVRVARFAPSPDAIYAMFSGGGLVWAEAELKTNGLRAVSPDVSEPPDLSGLSCRFNPVKAQHGLMLSLIASQRDSGSQAAFQLLVTDLLTLIDSSPDAALPIREEAIPLPWPPRGFISEARLQRRPGQSIASSMLRVGARTLGSALIMVAGRNIGRFSPTRYRKQLVANSDHRKFEDRLMMTVDCSPDVANAIEQLLAAAREAGIADYGLQRQDSALITCVVPSPMRADHVHFIDGSAGGYALAALDLKRSQANSASIPLAPNAIT